MAGEEGKFTIVDKEGNKTECDVLFTFESDETHKNYIVYTDNSIDEHGNTRVYASIYDPKTPGTSLMPIESEKEWKIIETILEDIQKEVQEDDNPELKNNDNNGVETEVQDDIDLNEIQGWLKELPSFEIEQTMDDNSFDTFIKEKKLIIKEKGGDIGQLEGVVSELSGMLPNENNLIRVDALFELLDSINGIESFTYSNMAMEAYEKRNYAVSEMGYRKAVKLCNDDSACMGYKNNLAYLIRRGEIRNPDQRSAKEVVLLLRDGTEKKDTFSLINMALLWALEFGTESDWDMADNLASFVNRNNIISALQWWHDVANAGEAEGYLVHLLMVRHGKIGNSPLGDIKSLFEMVKKDYPMIPEKMKEIITPFDGGKTGELSDLPPWIGDDDIKW